MSFNALSFILLVVAALFLVVAVILARKNAGVEARLQAALTENEALSHKAQTLETLQQQNKFSYSSPPKTGLEKISRIWHNEFSKRKHRSSKSKIKNSLMRC